MFFFWWFGSKVIAFCPLPSPLPRGEGTDCRKSDNGRFQHHHSLSEEEGQIAENPIIVGFSTIIPSPWKREQIAENPIMVGFSTIIPSLRGRGLGRGQNPRMRVSFFLMANLPVSFSQTMCIRFSGEGRLKRIWQQLFFMFFFWWFR